MTDRAHETAALFELLGDHLEPTDVVWCVDITGADLRKTGARIIDLHFDGKELRFGGAARGSGVTSAPAPTVVALVDVLSRAEDAVGLLLELRRNAQQAHLFVAEPRACAGQTIKAPRRRHYSQPGLRQTLNQGGFRPELWLVDSSFTGGLGSALPEATARAFELAHRADEAALAALQRVITEQQSPEVRAEACVVRAERYHASGRGVPARDGYLAALAECPEHARALSGLARLTLHAGDAARATEFASRAFQHDPACGEAAATLARCLEHMCPDASLEAWRHARNLAPADAAIVTAFARAATDAGDIEAAIDAMERLLDYGSQSADFHVTLAWLLLKQSRAGDASVEAEITRAIDPDHPMLADLVELMPA
jgi:tetratricopeptide (TPR) repeat protein